MNRLMKRGILLLLALSVLVVCVGCGKKFQCAECKDDPKKAVSHGVELANAGDEENALRHWEWAAEQENADALGNLGVHYYYKSAASEEPDRTEYWKKAVDYCERAAEQGDVNAVYTLGLLHFFVEGHVDYDKARQYYEQAAEQGNAGALLNLGTMYADGTGVEKNTDKALEYWEQAAAQGNAGALDALGVHYYYKSAESEEPDRTEYWKKAVDYCERAAAQGHVKALFDLGLLYSYIDGHEDYAKAVEYYDQAAALGDEQAAANAAGFREKLNG